MKELSIEEKAKAYDEAKEKAKVLKECSTNTEVVRYMDELFPELAESEDKRIRKAIKKALQVRCDGSRIISDEPVTLEEAIAWLEKQGKNNMGISEATKKKLEDNLNKSLEKETPGSYNEFLGEQKPTDKVEPKFKVGDIITDGKIIGKIDKNKNNKYHGWFGYNRDLSVHYADIPDVENWHLWTIQDAKDGDVLAYVTDEEDLWIMIYWSLYEPYEGHVHYHALLVNDNFADKGTCCICIDNLKPATKKQCDLLFQKMKEAGYEWDANKKEPRKSTQQEAEHGKYYYCIKDYFCGGRKQASKGDVVQALRGMPIMGLEDISEYFLPTNFIEYNSSWSEEDDKFINFTCDLIAAHSTNGYIGGYYAADLVSWLKSLKDRVQPQNGYNPYKEVVESIAEMCKHYDKASHSGLRDFYDNVKVKCKDAKEYDSLYSQNTWKPSEEQMELLREVQQALLGKDCHNRFVNFMCELKRLREE